MYIQLDRLVSPHTLDWEKSAVIDLSFFLNYF